MFKMALSTGLIIFIVAAALIVISSIKSEKAITVEIEKQLEYQLDGLKRTVLREQEGILEEITAMSSTIKGFNLQNRTIEYYLNEEVDLLARDVNSILYYLERIKNN